MRLALRISLILAALLLAYLLAWPSPVAPVAWDAPEGPGFARRFASNGRLASAEVFARELRGPEALILDAQGRLYTGTLDGEVVRVDPRTSRVETLANTGGRPLGMALSKDERELYVADAHRGILALTLDTRKLRTLVEQVDGKRLLFADDISVARDGSLLFTDASQRFDLEAYELDALEHSNTGRLLRHHPATGRTEVVASGLSFANGIALEPEGLSVLVNETWAYRVRRFFFDGPRRGQTETVIDNLPGFPDNLRYDPQRKLYWVALASPRDAGLDALAPYPFLRRIVSRLPKALRPKPKHHALLLAIRGDGEIVHFLDDAGASSYAPVTCVVADEKSLFLGSLEHAGLARLPLPTPSSE